MKNKDILKYDDSEKLIGVKILNPKKSIDFENIYYNKSFQEELIKKTLEEKKELEKINKKAQIAILVRTNKEVKEISEIFVNEGIKITTNESKSIYEVESTLDLYKLILALKYNDDAKVLYNFGNTNYQKNKVNNYEILIRKNNKKELLNYLVEKNSIENWNTHLENLRKIPVMKVLKDIINESKPWKNFSSNEIDNIEKKKKALYYKRNLEQLLEIIIKSYESDYITLNNIEQLLKSRILSKTKEKSREGLIEEDDSSVEIICTTIHKAKGLEYDVILLPYAARDIEIKKDSGLVEIIIMEDKIGYSLMSDEFKSFERLENYFYKKFKQGEHEYKTHEEARVLYVAMTRAIKKFIYFSDVAKEKKGNLKVQDILNEGKGSKVNENSYL